MGGAKREPHRFQNPERFYISRPRSAHLAFGFGPHLCLGERLARLQAEVVLLEMLRRFPNIHLSGPEPEWNDHFALRELKALPRSEEHTSELQSLMRISYAVFCLKQKKHNNNLVKQKSTCTNKKTT